MNLLNLSPTLHDQAVAASIDTPELDPRISRVLDLRMDDPNGNHVVLRFLRHFGMIDSGGTKVARDGLLKHLLANQANSLEGFTQMLRSFASDVPQIDLAPDQDLGLWLHQHLGFYYPRGYHEWFRTQIPHRNEFASPLSDQQLYDEVVKFMTAHGMRNLADLEARVKHEDECIRQGGLVKSESSKNPKPLASSIKAEPTPAASIFQEGDCNVPEDMSPTSGLDDGTALQEQSEVDIPVFDESLTSLIRQVQQGNGNEKFRHFLIRNDLLEASGTIDLLGLASFGTTLVDVATAMNEASQGRYSSFRDQPASRGYAEQAVATDEPDSEAFSGTGPCGMDGQEPHNDIRDELSATDGFIVAPHDC